jgi:hypothetical protein
MCAIAASSSHSPHERPRHHLFRRHGASAARRPKDANAPPGIIAAGQDLHWIHALCPRDSARDRARVWRRSDRIRRRRHAADRQQHRGRRSMDAISRTTARKAGASPSATPAALQGHGCRRSMLRVGASRLELELTESRIEPLTRSRMRMRSPRESRFPELAIRRRRCIRSKPRIRSPAELNAAG